MNRSRFDRRQFLQSAAASTLAFPACQAEIATAASKSGPEPIIDTHMHVWANNPRQYPFPHPYLADFAGPDSEATVEMLIDDMDQYGCTHAVLVQVIYHGWNNEYVADCVKRFPNRLKAHGLIDPTDPAAADRLEYWVGERGLSGMRFSPIYYQDGQHGGDAWLTAPHTHRLWKAAAKLSAVFNFFIASGQLPRLAQMTRAYPDVRIVIDHLSQVDLGGPTAETDLQRLLDMAKYPNVWVKVSELTSVSASGEYPFEDAYAQLKRVYEAFGSERLLFGTGYPGETRGHFGRPTLGQEIDLIRTRIPFLSPKERANILGRNATRLWGFESG